MTKYALCGGKIIPFDGIKDTIENGVVAINNETIEYVGSRDGFKENGSYKVYDVSGKTIIPGMVDSHVIISGTETMDPVLWMQEENEYEAIIAAKQAQAILEHGFTSVREFSRYGYALKRAIAKGGIQGPRIYTTGRGISRTGGHGDVPIFPPEFVEMMHPWATVADTITGVKKKAREALRMNADAIKIWASGGGMNDVDLETNQHFNKREIEAIVLEAAQYRKGVIPHCENVETVRDCIETDCISIEHGEDMDDTCIKYLAEKGIPLIPTLFLLTAWFKTPGFEPPYRPILDNYEGDTLAEKEINRIFSNFKKCLDAGVKLCLGSHCVSADITPYGETGLNEIYCFVQAGATEMEALRAATINGAELLGFDKFTGTLEQGKMADLVILDKNPLEDIKNLAKENICAVIKEGHCIVKF